MRDEKSGKPYPVGKIAKKNSLKECVLNFHESVSTPNPLVNVQKMLLYAVPLFAPKKPRTFKTPWY